MHPFSTRVAAVAGALALIGTALVGTSAGAGASPEPWQTGVLPAGQSVFPNFDSANDEFEMTLTGHEMDLDQVLPYTEHHRVLLGSITTWTAAVGKHPGASDAKLTMQRNGDLVLRDRQGEVLWHSGTAGTGSDNRAVLTNQGDLVVITDGGKRVWSAGTGPTMMVSGSTLNPGQSLRSRFNSVRPWARLTMTRGGDLRMSWGGRTEWTSRTHVRGSRLVGRRSGRWQVVTPAGKVLWSSPTAHGQDTELSVSPAGTQACLQIDGPGRTLLVIG